MKASNGTITTTEATISRIRNFEIQSQIVTEQRTIQNTVQREISGVTQDELVLWVDPVAQ